MLKHIPSVIREAVVVGYYCASIPYSCLKINMVSTIVFRLQQPLSFPHPLPVLCAPRAEQGSRGLFMLSAFQMNRIRQRLFIGECILQGGMGAGAGLIKISHGVDLWKLLNMEVAVLSYCTAV